MFLKAPGTPAASLQCFCLQDQTKIITHILFAESVIIRFGACVPTVVDNKQMRQRFLCERCLWKNEGRHIVHIGGLVFRFLRIFL